MPASELDKAKFCSKIRHRLWQKWHIKYGHTSLLRTKGLVTEAFTRSYNPNKEETTIPYHLTTQSSVPGAAQWSSCSSWTRSPSRFSWWDSSALQKWRQAHEPTTSDVPALVFEHKEEHKLRAICCCDANQMAQNVFSSSDWQSETDNSNGRVHTHTSTRTFFSVFFFAFRHRQVSLDAGLRMEGTPAMNLWDTIIDIFHVTAGGDSKLVHRTQILKHQEPLEDIAYVLATARLSSMRTSSYIFEDNAAVRKQISKGRSPTMRHVSRTHHFDLDRLYDRIDLDPMIQIKCVNTTQQAADILSKGSFTRDR